MNQKIHVGLIQLSCTQDPAENLARHIESIRTVAQQGAQVVVLQELFRSVYFCDEERPETFDLAESIPGPTTDTFSKLASELGVVIVASLFEKRAEGLFHNTTAVLDADGSYLGKYRKMHIPEDPGYYEKYYFTPGDLGFKSFATKYGNIGVLICWDQWFPEAARLTAMQGADFLVYPTAIGWAQGEKEEINAEQRDAWITIQRSHAIANGIPVISVNRVGAEALQTFWGSSFVCNGHGRILKQLSSNKEEIAVVELDLNEKSYYRRMWPYFRDRRNESYGLLTQK